MIRLGEVVATTRETLTFAVMGDDTTRVTISRVLWEDLRNEAMPSPSFTDDDLRDYALGMIEHLATIGDERVTLERM